MAESNLNLYKKLQRRENRSKARQAIFISEYVFTKYFDIYHEAAQLFNQINVIHPKKPDLRRSIEFKNWKRELRGQPKIPESKRRDPDSYPCYQSISFGQPPKEAHDVQYVPEGVNDNTALAQIVRSLPKKTMQLRIPLISPPKTSPQEGATVNNDEVLEEGATVNNDEVLGEGATVNNDEVLGEGATVNNDEVLGEGATVNNDEVLDIEPSLCEDISPEMMEGLLAELRADPNIAALMDDIEASFGDFNIDHSIDAEHPEIDQQGLELGMEVEIDDRLEKELEDTLLW